MYLGSESWLEVIQINGTTSAALPPEYIPLQPFPLLTLYFTGFSHPVSFIDEGTLKTPIPKCRPFLFGVVKQFFTVGSESGQKQSVKLLQNMVYNTTQNPPPPQPHTVCIKCTFSLGRGEVREKVEG